MNNEQERFWMGEFGDTYHERQDAEALVGGVEANVALFARILSKTPGAKRLIEFGAGTGRNLFAIEQLRPEMELVGVEINERAATQISTIAEPFVGSIFDYIGPQADIVLTKGLLIHIAQQDIEAAYDMLYHSSSRYIVLCEYYSQNPQAVQYRGYHNMLVKRDFAGELMCRHADLALVDYGFVYHKDEFPQDDLTYFILEKRS